MPYRWLQLLMSVAIVAAQEEEEIKSASAANLGVGLMLLGGIGFMMGIFYMVNSPDEEMRLYSWKAVCTTISIFSSVLVFQCIDGLLDYYFKAEGIRKIAITFGQCLFWYISLQILLAYVAGVLRFPWQAPMKHDEEVFMQHKLASRCWAVLLGHITSFASISAWGRVQHSVPGGMAGALAVVPVEVIALTIVFYLTDVVREYVIAQDGSRDKFEHLWDEMAEDTENDIMGLTVSFTFVQVVRAYYVGVMPNSEGEFEDIDTFSPQAISSLFLLGLALLVLNFVRHYLFGKNGSERVALVHDITVAWCFMFGTDEFLSNTGIGGDQLGAIGEVALALIVTFATFLVIWFLDKVADCEFTGKTADKLIRGIIEALGILIGFSWEKCFDTSVVDIAAAIRVIPPPLTKLALAIFLAGVTIPAWRWYILPVVFELGGFDEEEEGEEKEEKGGKEEGKEGYIALEAGEK